MRYTSVRLACLFVIALTILTGTNRAGAQVLIYSDITTFTGFGYANGSSATVSGDGITEMVADDIHFSAPLNSHYTINQFRFSVANFNTVTVSARPLVRFYNNDGSGGGPGTFIAGFNFNPISFTASTVSTFTFTSPNLFVIPNSDVMWAGMIFDNNNGATGATLTQLNSLGQGIFNPPTAGSSQDVFFQTSAAGSFVLNNPIGGFFNFGGTPVANFGWAFAAAPVPEPSTFALILAIVPSGLAAVRRRRRNR